MFDVNEYLEENEETFEEVMDDFEGLDEYLLDPIEAEMLEAQESIHSPYYENDFDNVA